MIARTSASGLPGFAAETCRLPVHSLSSQTRHILDQQQIAVRQSQQMLSLFVLVLCLALATVVCLLVTTTPVGAMELTLKPPSATANGLVALGAIVSLCASAAIGVALVKNQLIPAKKRPKF